MGKAKKVARIEGDRFIHATSVYPLKQVRDEIETLKKQLKELEALQGERELDLIDKLKEGYKPGLGCPGLAIAVDERRTPRWKEEFIRVAGKGEAEKVTANTEPTYKEKLVISAEAPTPLKPVKGGKKG